MANDVSDTVRDALGHVVREAIKNIGDASPGKPKRGALAGPKGLAAGAGLAAMAPLAKKGVDAIRSNGGLPTPSPGKAASKAGDKVGSHLKSAVSGKVDEAGGAGGLAKQAASGLLPGLGGDSDDEGAGGGMPGVGKGRRMPVQQAIDVAVPIETAYNQFTQFEDWPEFMHRVTRVTQDDETTLKFATKIWGKTKEFEAKIETQRPDERIKWRVAEGITHSGVVTFHELAPRLTRIEVNLDVDPGSLIEKAARGMRHIKRGVRADLARYKAFIEMQELETGAWRGVIEDSEVVEPHDDSYDEERDYSDVDDLYDEESSAGRQDEDDEDEDEDEQPRRRRSAQSSGGSGGGRSSSRSAATSRSSSSRSSGSKSGSSRSSGSKSGSSRSSGSKSGSSRSSGSKSSSSRSSGSKSASRSNGSKSGSTKSRGSSNGKTTSSSSRRSSSSGNGSSGSGTSRRRKTASRS